MHKPTNISQEYIQSYREVLGQQIKSQREEAKMNQQQLGEAVGVTKHTINKVENGNFAIPIDVYIKIATVLSLKIKLQ